jgi:hypothetical protein
VFKQAASRPESSRSGNRERTRRTLAHVIVWALVAVSGGALVLVGIGRISVQELPSVMAIGTPLVGIAGAVVGFYFRAEDA